MDAEMTDLVITLHEAWVDKIDEALHRMQVIGLDVHKSDRAHGIIEGSIESHHVLALLKLEPVAYLRKVIEYCVNFPPGDPRDRDGR